MGQGINTLSLELDDKEALALAQFVKRLTWSDLRGGAVDDDEAYVIKDAVDKLQRAMAEEGVSLDIENYCTLRLFFDLSTLAGLSRRNLPEAGIRLLFQI
ncbi:DUF7706 family protein [Escherichia coli]|uniref:DUF7706 family protein n=1 Tax=Escherichia coli TaxID=562 RepID=UPI0040451392